MKKELPIKFGVLISVVGFLMMVFGAYNGEMTAVFNKAVRICLECIGIG